MLAAMPILAGRLTVLDPKARTITLRATTMFTLGPGISLHDFHVGSNVSVVYEEVDGALAWIMREPAFWLARTALAAL